MGCGVARDPSTTREHLGTTDKAIIAIGGCWTSDGPGRARRAAADACRTPRRRRDDRPITVDGIAPAQALDAYWREFDRQAPASLPLGRH